ncbi:hypothetical protein [Terrimonas alba]|uniref:hypothetical protein n=1 Tax=Terrimonas alba TaxID=3349636 RepID=UPI0035F2DDCC
MSLKTCLFIADEDVTEITDKVIGSLKKQGITFNFKHIDLRNEKYYSQEQSNESKHKLDFEKIKGEINEKYINHRFDLVACDFNYAKDPLDGFKVIKWLKNESESRKRRIRRARFVLYSSEQEKFIQMTNTVEELTRLIRLKIEDFLDRRNLADAIIRTLANEEKDVSELIISELEKFSSLEFRSVYPPFKGKKLGEIAGEIEIQSHHGVNFQKNIIEYTIAHLVELNKE